MTWHHDGTTADERDPSRRLISRDGVVGSYVIHHDDESPNTAYVDGVQAHTRGGGRLAMTHLASQADKHGVTLRLIAEPIMPQGDGKKMKPNELSRWYKTFGFKLTHEVPARYGIRMMRTPKKSLQKAMTTVHLKRPVETRSAIAPDDWHHEGSETNPLNNYSRLVKQGDTVGKYELKEVTGHTNLYHVGEVQAISRGGGRAAMEHLTRQADRHGVSLRLFAEPLRPAGEGVKMTRNKLRTWYRGFGFRPQRGDLMVRAPQTLLKGQTTNRWETTMRFQELYNNLEKAFFGQRKVQWIGGTNPSPTNYVEDSGPGKVRSTLTREGKMARITSLAQRFKNLPGMVRDKVQKVVTDVSQDLDAPAERVAAKRMVPKKMQTMRDTDTANYTMMRDGSVQKIQFFAKGRFGALLQRMLEENNS